MVQAVKAVNSVATAVRVAMAMVRVRMAEGEAKDTTRGKPIGNRRCS
jgi:hypothetical protein